jgi:ATP-dependent RNA helicase DDX49/DBP8
MVARIANSSADMSSPASGNVGDFDVQSEPLTQESSNLDSDSDSLDSTASRKRRKASPEKNDSLDQDDDSPLPSRISAPSRIKVQFNDRALNKNPPSRAILAPTDPHTNFLSLNVKPWLVASLGSMAIKRPTGIQKGCIPEILKGRDCIGGSRTGSGKTVAFAVPILQKWSEDPIGIFAVILTPTRYSSILSMIRGPDLLTLLSIENWRYRYTNNSGLYHRLSHSKPCSSQEDPICVRRQQLLRSGLIL